MNESLPKLLLRLSEAGDPTILWGRQAKPHFGKAFDRLLHLRVLIEQAPAATWSVCADCDCELDARPITEINGRWVAECPLDHAADAILHPDDLRSFRIDPGLLVTQITTMSQIGSAPGRVAEGIWDLGRLSGDRAVILVLSSAAVEDPNTVSIIRGAVQAANHTLLIPTRCSPQARRRIADAGFHTVDTVAALTTATVGLSFALDRDQIVPRSMVVPRLLVHRSRQGITLDGTDVDLAPRSFNLMVLLAQAALEGRIATHPEIEGLWATVVDKTARGDAIRDLRQDLEKGMPRGFDPKTFIITRSGQGYGLAVAPGDVSIQP